MRKGVAMADEPREAIEIIGALNNAGLLRTGASGGPESPAASGAIGIIGALRDAGLLATGTVGLTAPPDPQQGPQVGDIVRAGEIRQINKLITPDGTKKISFLSKQPEGRWWSVYCDFPPNDDHWLAEIENVLASPKPSVVLSVLVEVTREIATDPRADTFEGKLKDLRTGYRTPPQPPWTEG
jgi:hypothetical protein